MDYSFVNLSVIVTIRTILINFCCLEVPHKYPLILLWFVSIHLRPFPLFPCSIGYTGTVEDFSPLNNLIIECSLLLFQSQTTNTPPEQVLYGLST